MSKYWVFVILIWIQLLNELPQISSENISFTKFLLSEPGYLRKLNSVSSGKVTVAGVLDEMIFDDHNCPANSSETCKPLEEKAIDPEISISKLYKSVYIWWIGIYSYILNVTEGFTPKGIFKYICDNKATVMSSLVIASIVGTVLLFLYWSFKMPQLCLASFQVYIRTLPLWISMPIIFVFSAICVMYTISNGDLYSFYKDLYEKKELTFWKTVGIGVSQILIRSICSIVVAFVSVLPPVWIVVYIYDTFIAGKSNERLNKSLIVKKLKNWDFGYYLGWIFGTSMLGYVVLSLLISKNLVRREVIYDLHLVEQSK